MGSSESKVVSTEDSREYLGTSPFCKDDKRVDSSYLNEELSDFEIHIIHSSGKFRFPCHKFVLRKYGGSLSTYCEKDNSSQLIIRNIKPQIMEMVLRYLYETEILLEDWKMAIEVLDAASQYEIVPLVQECEDFLLKSLTFRNVCKILRKSKSFSSNRLKDQCLELCKNACFIVIKTRAFMLSSVHTVKDILENNDLNIRGEFFLFDALWSWARMQCVSEDLPLTESYIGKKFSNLASYVRFDCMSEKQKELLPQSVKLKYLKRPQNGENTSATPSYPKENRGVKFPLKLNKDCYFTLVFEPKENPISKNPIIGSFIQGIIFRVTLDAYVVSLTTLCLKKDSLNCVKNLKLSSASGILFSWEENNEKYVRKSNTRSCVFADSTNIVETEFSAVVPLLLSAGITYTIKIEPVKQELEWPQTVAVVDRKKSDLEIALCDSLCCGFKNIMFVQAK